ncbi:hypothetical protein J1605_022616 [Eschrichtius robustus]|uniref:Uncharacterized protein n=1 Tax=Eschrichtius robustus TaxID=9764 RepID=A0AB34HBC0_ESCRO|nr:hypothetical protein J1605_022616 [Eschrichtius robustus]
MGNSEKQGQEGGILVDRGRGCSQNRLTSSGGPSRASRPGVFPLVSGGRAGTSRPGGGHRARPRPHSSQQEEKERGPGDAGQLAGRESRAPALGNPSGASPARCAGQAADPGSLERPPAFARRAEARVVPHRPPGPSGSGAHRTPIRARAREPRREPDSSHRDPWRLARARSPDATPLGAQPGEGRRRRREGVKTQEVCQELAQVRAVGLLLVVVVWRWWQQEPGLQTKGSRDPQVVLETTDDVCRVARTVPGTLFVCKK